MSTPASTAKKNIAMVDDHTMLREGLQQLIDSQPDMRCSSTTSNTQDALRELEKNKPDLLAVDISMPGRNGLELIKDALALYPDLPILVISMHDESFYAQRVLKAGARGFLLKSDAMQFLVSAVESLTAHRPFFTGKVSQTLLETYLSKGSVDEAALTSREKAVVQLIAEGKTNKQIADILSVSTKTVETHRAMALRKLNLDTTAALIRYAIKNKLVEN